MTAYRKKLIEVALPLTAINDHAAYEKLPGIGAHPRGVHHWWARRPLTVCRSILFAQLVDDPSEWPTYFSSPAQVRAERARLHAVLVNLSDWKRSEDTEVIYSAQLEVARTIARNAICDAQESAHHETILGSNPSHEALRDYLREFAPPIYDPFAGGGAIPLEAMRLGLRSLASDLNPVAVLVNKFLIELGPRVARTPAVNPHGALDSSWSSSRLNGLVSDIRHYGKLVLERARERLGSNYVGGGQPGSVPLAWLWCRTVPSPDPAFSSKLVPLLSSYLLAKRKKHAVWLEPVVDQERAAWRFEIANGSKADLKKLAAGNKIGRANFTCLLSGSPISAEYIRQQGRAGKLGLHMFAVVERSGAGKHYRAPTAEEQRRSMIDYPDDRPETPLPESALGFRVQNYGITSHYQHFLPRQMASLCELSTQVNAIWREIEHDAKQAIDATPSWPAGLSAEDYADAVTLILAFVVDRCVDFNNCGCGWRAGNEKIMSIMSKQIIPMTWDFGEANILAKTVGGFEPALDYVSECVLRTPTGHIGKTWQADATSVQLAEKVVISSDPPYYDNVPYADLSDFFYIFLRKSLRGRFREILRTVLVPKSEELIAEPARQPPGCSAEDFFLDGMKNAITTMACNSSPKFPLTIYYAFKQSETRLGATASTGWETFLEGVLAAGLAITATLPVRSEQSTRWRGLGANALASSVVLVCRKRPNGAATATRGGFRRLLKQELPMSLAKLQEGNIAPVDLAQASIGPGMAVFSRHAKVLEADGKAMTVRSALQLIHQVMDEIRGEDEGELDRDTRFAVTWFESHGFDAGPYGDAETLAKARSVSVSGVQEAGVLHSAAGKVRLLKRAELPDDWDPATDKRLTVWEATQHLIKRLDKAGESAAASLIAKLGTTADQARDLAYRLYTICERKGWAEEARAYNGLVIAWPELEKLASSTETTNDTPAQAGLFE